MNNWSLSFSRYKFIFFFYYIKFLNFKYNHFFFSFYEVYKFAGPPLLTNEIVIAINSKCLTFLDHDNQMLVDYYYPEIASVSCTMFLIKK